MSPTFKEDDVVLVNRLSYFLKEPKIGDIVALRLHLDVRCNLNKDLNKERHIIKYIAKIDNDKYFVLGENLRESTDSRDFGWISRKEIVGKVIYKI